MILPINDRTTFMTAKGGGKEERESMKVMDMTATLEHRNMIREPQGE